jgi:hypothetical protein
MSCLTAVMPHLRGNRERAGRLSANGVAKTRRSTPIERRRWTAQNNGGDHAVSVLGRRTVRDHADMVGCVRAPARDRHATAQRKSRHVGALVRPPYVLIAKPRRIDESQAQVSRVCGAFYEQGL